MVMAMCGLVYRRMERVLRLTLPPQSVFIDAGAHVGFVSLLACSLSGPAGRIAAHSFEPDPTAFTWLERNAALNDFDIAVNPVALGRTETRGELTLSARGGWSTLAQEPPGGFSFLPKAGTTVVDVLALDTYCAARHLRPSVVKIDVEGYEIQVIDGARDLLRDVRPSLIVEINPTRLEAAGASAAELIDQLRALNYRLFHVDRARVTDARGRTMWNGLPEVKLVDIHPERDCDVVGIA